MIDEKTFNTINREYQKRWGFSLIATDPNGITVFDRTQCGINHSDCSKTHAHAISEAYRWGEATIGYCVGGKLIWAIPIMYNMTIEGGVIASASEKVVFSQTMNGKFMDLRRACADLRELLESYNLTNAAALALNRQKYEKEQRRAYAIHDYKTEGHGDIREIYMREEPELFSAIRCGDKSNARKVLNRILVSVYAHAGNNLDIVKSIFMELFVSMCRTAIESGGDTKALLSANFKIISTLSGIDDDEALTLWLVETFEKIFDSIQKIDKAQNKGAIFSAISFMQEHCTEQITREDVAKIAFLSPQYFSTLLKKESGTTFTSLLNQMRVEKAEYLLVHTDTPLSILALDAGFQDQSYFTKVFKKYRHTTPLSYRKNNR